MCLDPHLNLGERLAPLNPFKPSSKKNTDRSKAVLLMWIFYVFLSCVCYTFVRVCLYVRCGHLLGKGWHLGSRLWCLPVSLSLFHWYPESGVVLHCIDSWFCTLTDFAQGHNPVTLVRLEPTPLCLESSTHPLSHYALPRSGTIYAILEEDIMWNIHVKLFEICTVSGSGDVI